MFDKLFNLRAFIIDLSNYLSLELVKHYLFGGLKQTSIILLFMENKQSNPIQLQVSWTVGKFRSRLLTFNQFYA